MKITKHLLIFFLLLNWTSAKAQTLQIGLYTGVNHYFNYPLFFLGGATASTPITVWDNEIFARFEYKRIAVETAYGPFFRKDLFGNGEATDYSTSTEYRYHLKDDFKNWQWQLLLQYRVRSFFSNKLKCYAGLSYNAIYEKATRSGTLTNVSNSSDVQSFGVFQATLCPYLGADIMAEYKLSKHIQLYAKFDFKVESNGPALYESGQPFFYSALPTASASVLIGASYSL